MTPTPAGILTLVHPTRRLPTTHAYTKPVLHHVDPRTTRAVAECFLAARTSVELLVAIAYAQLQTQTDRQYAALTDPRGPFRVNVVSTREQTPYAGADELIASVHTTRTLEVTTASADRTHPLLDGAVGGAYFRFRAVHDLVGHVATGYGFDADGEYSAGSPNAGSTTGSPAGLPLPNCMARSACCGRRNSSPSIKPPCWTPRCSSDRHVRRRPAWG
jgi:hypothetical protein